MVKIQHFVDHKEGQNKCHTVPVATTIKCCIFVNKIVTVQDVEVTGDKDDSRSLHITIHKPSMNVHARPLPLLSARFVFDDHIRCMAAKQRLTKGRLKARQRKPYFL